VPHSPKRGRIKEFLLDAREKRAQDRFPLGLFLYPPPVFDGTPPMGENFILGSIQRFCPRGEVSASADEGGIPVCSFCRTDGIIPVPPSAHCATPPMGENLTTPPAFYGAPPMANQKTAIRRFLPLFHKISY